MSIVTARHTGIAMNHLIADSWKPLITISAIPAARFAHEIRFVAGIAIALGGAGLLLSDLIHVAPSFG